MGASTKVVRTRQENMSGRAKNLLLGCEVNYATMGALRPLAVDSKESPNADVPHFAS